MHSLTLAALSALLVGVSTSGLAIAWAKPISYRLPDETAKFKAAAEIVDVNQCSGDSCDFMPPGMAGGQLAHGAMGNASWKGVPLKAVLDEAGAQAKS